MTPGFPVAMFKTIAEVTGAELHLEQTLSGPAPRTDPSVAALRVIDRLGPWPTQPLVARTGLPDDLVADLRSRLLDGSTTEPLASQLRGAAPAGLVEVDASHYDPVRRALSRSD